MITRLKKIQYVHTVDGLYIHTMDSSIKGSEVLIHAAVRMILEDTVLGEGSQSKRSHSVMPLI